MQLHAGEIDLDDKQPFKLAANTFISYTGL